MFNLRTFLKTFWTLTVGLFVIMSTLTGLILVGSLIHPIAAIILPIIGIITMISIVSAYEHP